MVDLVKQLREPVSGESAQVMVRWAADEIERLRRLLRAVQTDPGNWLHSKLQDKIDEAVGEAGPYRDLDDPGVVP